ncbi:hypothetical protein [Methylocystis parvus]|uniref:hypothetical protein n=1 Tax=Methylocystis parvus TaxID=134 RepID=UPI003C7448D8
MQDAWTIITNIFAFFGGSVAATAGIGFFANFFVNKALERQKSSLNQELERFKSELSKEAEKHKLSLKKEEIIFNKEIEAANAFMKLQRNTRPTFSHPNMDFDEACTEVVEHFPEMEARLEVFMISHGPFISPLSRQLIQECISIARDNKFASIEEGSWLEDAKKNAGELLQKLPVIEDGLIASLRN